MGVSKKPPGVIEEIIEQYKAGYGMQNLCLQHHIDKDKVRRILVERDIYQCEEHRRNLSKRRTIQGHLNATRRRKRKGPLQTTCDTDPHYLPDGRRNITNNISVLAKLLTAYPSGEAVSGVVEYIRSTNVG